MSAYPLDTAAKPDRIYELLGDPLMRLGPDGTFEVWNPVLEEYHPLVAEEIDLLRWFATPITVAEAADAAGYACDEALLTRVRWYAQQHILRPLRALPGLPAPEVDPLDEDATLSVSRTGERVAIDANGAMAPARSGPRPTPPSPAGHFPLRLQDGIYFRLTPRSADVYVWVPKLNAFRSLNWYWLRLAATLATGRSVRQAAEAAGLVYDKQVETAVSMLLDHGVLVGTPGVAPRRVARVSGL
jgi:hypothetical protein